MLNEDFHAGMCQLHQLAEDQQRAAEISARNLRNLSVYQQKRDGRRDCGGCNWCEPVDPRNDELRKRYQLALLRAWWRSRSPGKVCITS